MKWIYITPHWSNATANSILFVLAPDNSETRNINWQRRKSAKYFKDLKFGGYMHDDCGNYHDCGNYQGYGYDWYLKNDGNILVDKFNMPESFNITKLFLHPQVIFIDTDGNRIVESNKIYD